MERIKNPSPPLVSIVTPLYNEVEHLAECIESILAQTYQNWDYTIVDNCSTDGSIEIARKYAATDRRIRIHGNQQFLEALPNHNVAMRQISPGSKYCKVVFADDWIFPECLERMVAVAEENSSAGIVGAYGLQGRAVMWTGLPYPSTLVFGREICRRLFLDRLYVFGSATSLLYRSDLVRNRDPFYNEATLYADVESCLVLLKNCDFGFVHQILTFTRDPRPGSLRTFSEAINTYQAGRLQALVWHGPDFLCAKEFQACLRRTQSEYYGLLAGGVIRGRDRTFWNYHRGVLADVGVGFSRTRVMRALLGKACGFLLKPQATIERAWDIAKDIRRTTRISPQ